LIVIDDLRLRVAFLVVRGWGLGVWLVHSTKNHQFIHVIIKKYFLKSIIEEVNSSMFL
jgi:hypothetical protein